MKTKRKKSGPVPGTKNPEQKAAFAAKVTYLQQVCDAHQAWLLWKEEEDMGEIMNAEAAGYQYQLALLQVDLTTAELLALVASWQTSRYAPRFRLAGPV